MPAPRFQFYEVVRVVSEDPELAEINGEVGTILGRSDETSGAFLYAVLIHRDDCCWSLEEAALETTGTISSREAHYGDVSIRVRVDEKGRGRIVD